MRLLCRLCPSLPAIFSSSKHLFIPCAGNASVWASESLEERPSILNPFGNGFHLERAGFDELIRTIVSQIGNETWQPAGKVLMKAKFTGVDVPQNCQLPWTVRMVGDSGEELTLRARWIVDATGRKASVASKVRMSCANPPSPTDLDHYLLYSQLGAKTVTSAPLLAFYALFAVCQDSQGDIDETCGQPDTDTRTLIEACPTGWFYTTLVPLHRSSSGNGCQPNIARVVAYHTLPTHPSAKVARRRAGFLDLVHTSTIHVSSVLQATDYDMLAMYPKCTVAGSSYLDKVGEVYGTGDHGLGGWVAVGDAASAFDPLSAQGMMSALESGLYTGRWLGDLLASPASVSPLTTIGMPSDTAAVYSEDQKRSTAGLQDVEAMYASMRWEYELSRRYFYGIVKRFGEEGAAFWDHVAQH
jgi:hypothetical protein